MFILRETPSYYSTIFTFEMLELAYRYDTPGENEYVLNTVPGAWSSCITIYTDNT